MKTSHAVLGGVAAACIVLAAPAAASAHIGAEADTTAAGSTALIEFAVGHGCDGSPTTALTIGIPDEVASVRPTAVAGWQVEQDRQPVDGLTDAHGDPVTERVASVTFVPDAPLADDLRATVSLQAQLPGDAEGETLAFPVMQECLEGETDWSEIAADGEDPHDLDAPAPVIEVTAAGEGGEHAGHGAAAASEAAAATPAGPTTDPVARGIGIGGLVLGAAGIVVAAAGLRRRSTR